MSKLSKYNISTKFVRHQISKKANNILQNFRINVLVGSHETHHDPYGLNDRQSAYTYLH